jgi:hypothetical protein
LQKVYTVKYFVKYLKVSYYIFSKGGNLFLYSMFMYLLFIR